MKKPLTLVVITLNEEQNIERCLKSVPFADEIVVVDSGSHDRTCEIAKSLNAKVYVEPFKGYGPQKNFGALQASHDWILSLDADEALSSDLATEIQNLLKSENLENQDGYFVPRRSFHLGRWIKYGGWYPDRQLRLFHRGRAKWNDSLVHEEIQIEKVGALKNDILHWVFRDLSHQIEANNRYSSLGAQELLKRGKRFSIFNLIIKPITKFIECYLIKRGFLDGMPGFIIAVGAAYSVFLKWSKLWELKISK